MNETDLLQRLAAASRGEQLPPVDVVGRVMRELAAQRAAPPAGDRIWWIGAAVSAAAAAIVVPLSLQMYAAWSEPATNLLTSFDTVMK